MDLMQSLWQSGMVKTGSKQQIGKLNPLWILCMLKRAGLWAGCHMSSRDLSLQLPKNLGSPMATALKKSRKPSPKVLAKSLWLDAHRAERKVARLNALGLHDYARSVSDAAQALSDAARHIEDNLLK
ncbi:hypothetical protein [Comamonas thiooxydans]|uniref:hypothetical protein n=1 Tax=Comamonas thiooxydans TaxID=363952 RepID=UPI00103FB2F7|nr:hypothetical protein [Comamonas thiooxydans]